MHENNLDDLVQRLLVENGCEVKNEKPLRNFGSSPHLSIEPENKDRDDAHLIADVLSDGRVPDIASKVTDGEVVTVWYATNRESFTDKFGNFAGFNSNRSDQVRFGRCIVHVPKSRPFGTLGSNWWKRKISGQDDRVKLQNTIPMLENQYWSMISQIAQSEYNDSDTATIFIHGYNNSFERAAITSAQLYCDLSLNGPFAFYSWPSKGKIFCYKQDEASITASEEYVKIFIENFISKTDCNKLNLIFHSMGNRIITSIIKNLFSNENKEIISNIILAAPDVDADYFGSISKYFKGKCTRATLYVSARDRAVWASKRWHKADRVGLTPPVRIYDGIDTINVRNVDLSVLGHGYVGNAAAVLYDMSSLFAKPVAPDHRMRLTNLSDEKGHIYWEFIS